MKDPAIRDSAPKIYGASSPGRRAAAEVVLRELPPASPHRPRRPATPSPLSVSRSLFLLGSFHSLSFCQNKQVPTHCHCSVPSPSSPPGPLPCVRGRVRDGQPSPSGAHTFAIFSVLWLNFPFHENIYFVVFISPFILSINICCLLGGRHCSRCWGCGRKHNRQSLQLAEVYIPVERTG